MSLLVEIATRADVPLEAVVRVLTREPVNDDHKDRILEVLDHLDAEETRVLQRFALAAVHDELRPGGAERGDHEALVAELVDDPLELPEAVRLELGPGPAHDPGTGVEAAAVAPVAPQAFDPAPLVQLGSVLGELTEAVRELRHETDAERRERVDDLAVLIDLITKGWEGVDRRLGRVERQLGRLESSPPPQQEPAARIEPPPVPAPPEPPAPAPDDGDAEAGSDRSSTLRRRLPLFAALAFGIAIGAAAALDLPSRLDASTVADRSLTAEAAERTGAESSSTSTRTEKQPSQPPSRPRTTPRGTASSTTSAGPAPAAPATPMTSAAAPETTTAKQAPATSATPQASTGPASPGTGAAPPRTFTPSRTWAWPPVADADYYLVEFFRDGEPLYRARPTVARLTLPPTVRFTPGTYRWRVRPGRGAQSANLFGDPIVDSEFTLQRP